jgi:hypothetical protein
VKRSASDSSVTPTVRCAICTRKSSEEGLDKEFNSLDAQRESGDPPPIRTRFLEIAYAAGYMLKTEAAGWELFCGRLCPTFQIRLGQRVSSTTSPIGHAVGINESWPN